MSIPDAAGQAVPRRGRPGNDATSVLAAAVELFNAQGYDATSMSDLAAHLGLTKSAIYHHVPSKEALLGAALDEALDGLTEAIDAVADRPDLSAGHRLRAAVEASVHVLAERLPSVTLLLRVRGNSLVEQRALVRRRELDERLTALVVAAVDDGALRADLDPHLVSRLLFGTVNSLVEWYRPGGPLTPASLAAALTGVIFEGLAAR